MVALLAGGLLLLLAPGSALAAGPYPPPDEGSGHVDDSRVQAGGCVTFSGDGFAAFTTITVKDNGEFVGTTTTNAFGEFSMEVCFDADARTGRHVLTGTGTAADGSGSITVSAVVFIEGVSERPGDGDGEGNGDGNGNGNGIPRTGFAAPAIAFGAILLLAVGSALLLLLDKRRREQRRAALPQ